MTEQDLAKIKFCMASHINMTNKHTCIYESVDYWPKIIICYTAQLRKSGVYGKWCIRYTFNGRTYQNKKKFLEAMTEFEEERKSKFDKE